MKLLVAVATLFLLYAVNAQPAPSPSMPIGTNVSDPWHTGYPGYMEAEPCESWFCFSGASAVSSPSLLMVVLAFPLLQQLAEFMRGVTSV